MNCSPSCSLITALEVLEASFSLFLGLHRIYIKSSTRQYIFIVLPTFLDPKKCCRSYVEAGENCQNIPNSVAGPKMGSLEKIINPF